MNNYLVQCPPNGLISGPVVPLCRTIVSLVPVNDPTLFVGSTSGVATLKKYFDGTIIPETHGLPMRKSHPYQLIFEIVGKLRVTIPCLKC